VCVCNTPCTRRRIVVSRGCYRRGRHKFVSGSSSLSTVNRRRSGALRLSRHNATGEKWVTPSFRFVGTPIFIQRNIYTHIYIYIYVYRKYSVSFFRIIVRARTCSPYAHLTENDPEYSLFSSRCRYKT